MGCGDEKLSQSLTQTFTAHCNAMICQQVTLSGDAEWPKVADAVIEAKYPCSKKIDMERFLTRRMPLGSGLWHNTDIDSSRAFPPVAEGCPSCRSTRTSSRLC